MSDITPHVPHRHTAAALVALVVLAALLVAAPARAQAPPSEPVDCSVWLENPPAGGEERVPVEAGEPEHGFFSCRGGERGADLVVSVGAQPAHGEVTEVQQEEGEFSFEGSFRYTPATGYTGPDHFVMRFVDGAQQQDVDVKVTVGPAVNDPPTCGAYVGEGYDEPPHEVEAGEAEQGGIYCQDDEDQEVTVTQQTQPAHGQVADFSAPPDGEPFSGYTFTYRGAAAYRGADSFTVRASDGTTHTDFDIDLDVVAPVNATPECYGSLSSDQVPGTYVVTSGESSSGSISCWDDPGEESTLTLSVGQQPGHGAVSAVTQGTQTESSRSGSFTYTPTAGFAGDDSFVVRGSDGVNHRDLTLSLRVNDANADDPPICGATTGPFYDGGTRETVEAGTTQHGTLRCIDDEGDLPQLAGSILSQPGHGTVSNLSGSQGWFGFDYTPDAGYRGPDSFSFRGSANGKSDDAEVLVDVVGPDGEGDSDGDGVLNGADACPTVSAATPNGCPPAGSGGGAAGSQSGAGGGGGGGANSPSGIGGATGALATPRLLGGSPGTVTVAASGAFTLKTPKVGCTGAGPDCAVSTALTTQAGSASAAKAKKALRVGASRFTVKKGSTRGVTVKLTKPGRKLLKRRRTLKGKLKITVKRGSKTTTRTVSVTLKAAGRRR